MPDIHEGKLLRQYVLINDINVERDILPKIEGSLSKATFYKQFKEEKIKKEYVTALLKAGIDFLSPLARIKQSNSFPASEMKERLTTTIDSQQQLIESLTKEVALLRELIKSKDQIIDILKTKEPPHKITPVIPDPLEVRDLIDKETMKRIQKFFKDDISNSTVCVTDQFGKIEFVNDEFTNQTGYTIAEIKGKSPGDFMQHKDADPAVVKKMREAILKRSYFEGEVLNHKKNGDPIMCRLIITAIKINGIEKIISLAMFSKANVLKYN